MFSADKEFCIFVLHVLSLAVAVISLGLRYSRLRTTYYLTLGTLLFYQQRKAAVTFEQFVHPMDAIFLSLWQQTDEGRNPEAIRNPLCRDPLIGLVRDLRYELNLVLKSLSPPPVLSLCS